jgi:hypothetical protein
MGDSSELDFLIKILLPPTQRESPILTPPTDGGKKTVPMMILKVMIEIAG